MPQPRKLAPPADPQETLAWEERNRTWGVAAAGVGAALPLIGLFIAPKPKADQVPELTSALIYFHNHATGFVLSQIIIALGAIATGIALLYLYHATKARRPQLPSAARVLAILGPVLLAAAGIVGQVYLAQKAGDFVKTAKTDHGANQILTGGVRVATGSAGIAGQFALAFAIALIALNAMRAGLLTRFMGVLGMLVGVFPVLLSLLASTLSGVGGGPAPIVQFFWLGALAYLFSGRWPNGMPPAWKSGKEEPWPSSQELREQRQAQTAARRGSDGAAAQRPTGLLGMLMGGGQQRQRPKPAEPEPDVQAAPVQAEARPATRPSPATSARKRKRKKKRSGS
ncbi:MAG TPA: hypothetical protein VHR88_00935 [Solirubrobacteraceae bacterium]|nr:hypothetical protein [Solirubrobacteraceae bacterium]